MTTPRVSIIICTRNRADDLRRTLAALATVHVPEDLPCELIVVDNGSTDNTAQAVQEACLPEMPTRLLYEGRVGKGHAYNSGMAAARGAVLLFTDDDVRPPRDWVEGMCRPIFSGQADAVAGGVTIAPHLERDWMNALHRVRLAETGVRVRPEPPGRMTGANMAFAKAVLSKVPGFDTELGPGALGFVDETLFSRQLLAAGYRLVSAYDVCVEHHFDPSRLDYAFLLKTAQGHERSNAYVAWHWEHKNYRAVHLRILLRQARLAWMRLTRGQETGGDAPPFWEENNLEVIAFFRQFLVERKRPRSYDKHGLVKKTIA